MYPAGAKPVLINKKAAKPHWPHGLIIVSTCRGASGRVQFVGDSAPLCAFAHLFAAVRFYIGASNRSFA